MSSDEKTQYEKLKLSIVAKCQPLLRPFQLQLTPQQKIILEDHKSVIREQGFIIDYSSFQINAFPQYNSLQLDFSGNFTLLFDLLDLEELISKLGESHDSNVKCDRYLSMIASKACRKAIMIGTPLSKTQMRSIINNMSDLDQPWNCPHGRPTIRFLGNLGVE